jgi:predicted DNA-binding transcriptional regulator YafY
VSDGGTRSARLLRLLQALRRYRRPVTAKRLAEGLGVSARTLYRDIATLQDEGAPIAGEAGLGYVLQPGYFLPPLEFTAPEADALILGLRLVMARGDSELQQAAEEGLAKLEAALPEEVATAATANGLLAGPSNSATRPVLAVLRAAMQAEQKLRLRYGDRQGTTTERIVWPVAVGFFETVELLAAWCELRRDFRHFRLDRIASVQPISERMPRRRRVLLAEWRELQALEGHG